MVPIRVLVVTNMYPSAERPNWGTFVHSQVESLRALGVVSDVLVIDGYKSRWRYLAAIPRVLRRAIGGPYDLIHAHYGLSGIVARMQWRLPIVLSFCGDDLLGHADAHGRPTRGSLILASLHRWLARIVDGVIVKSQAMRALLPGIDAAVVPNGVDFTLFRPLDQAECRATLGLSPDTRYVLFPYRIDDIRKNHALAAEAVRALDTGATARTELLVVNAVPNGHMPLYMNAADVLLLPSRWEGSPNAVKEALACDLPIVATDVGDVRELIEGVQGCHLVEPTAASVTRGLARALAGPARTNGRERSEPLRAEAIAARVVAVYHAALPARSARPSGANVGTDRARTA